MIKTSISTKFLLVTFVVALIVFGAMGSFIVERGAQSLRNSLDSKGNSVSDLAYRQGADYLANFNFIAVDKFVEDILKDPEVSYVAFYNEKGEKVSKHPVPEDLSAIIIFKREMQDTDKRPLGSFQLGYKQDLIRKNVKSSIFLIAVSIGAAIFLFLTAIVSLVRGVTRRLREAVSVTSSIAQGDLGINIIKAGKDEIGELTRSRCRPRRRRAVRCARTFAPTTPALPTPASAARRATSRWRASSSRSTTSVRATATGYALPTASVWVHGGERRDEGTQAAIVVPRASLLVFPAPGP